MKHKGKMEMICYGGLAFRDETDLKAWTDTSLPTTKLFGLFIDVYSFLERIVSAKG